MNTEFEQLPPLKIVRGDLYFIKRLILMYKIMGQNSDAIPCKDFFGFIQEDMIIRTLIISLFNFLDCSRNKLTLEKLIEKENIDRGKQQNLISKIKEFYKYIEFLKPLRDKCLAHRDFENLRVEIDIAEIELKINELEENLKKVFTGITWWDIENDHVIISLNELLKILTAEC